ncbi:hypothetical protein H7097_04330 [Aeromicrobium sp.]|nr:hypothetical protein [Candidatus Saccharibacteria bacterium]
MANLEITLLTSARSDEVFDKTSTPLIIDAFESLGHHVTLASAEHPPTPDELLMCDVYIDRSPITDTGFFMSLAYAIQKRRAAGKTVPLLVDNPFATLIASDKRKTHALFPALIPHTENLDGTNNTAAFAAMASYEQVVIKDPFGWYSHGTELLTPAEAATTYADVTNRVMQKYIPFKRGVGRIVVANYAGDTEVLSNYLMIPNDWRTGVGVTTEFVATSCPPELTQFATKITRASGLYLNGIDYIERSEGNYALLETNAVPNLRVPHYYLGVNAPGAFASHVERSHKRMSRQ